MHGSDIRFFKIFWNREILTSCLLDLKCAYISDMAKRLSSHYSSFDVPPMSRFVQESKTTACYSHLHWWFAAVDLRKTKLFGFFPIVGINGGSIYHYQYKYYQ